jgi:hypothetical protein
MVAHGANKQSRINPIHGANKQCKNCRDTRPVKLGSANRQHAGQRSGKLEERKRRGGLPRVTP